MAQKPTYVWHGGAKLLYGKTYKPGHRFDDEFVYGLQNREALLSAGMLKVEMVDVAPPKTEVAASTTKTKSKGKKTAAKKPKPKTVKAASKSEE